MFWPDASARAKAIILAIALCGIACMLYVFPPQRYAIYPACPIHALFGVGCPGCGMTRALGSLVRGNVQEATRENVFSLPLVVFASIALARQFQSALLLNRWRGTL